MSRTRGAPRCSREPPPRRAAADGEGAKRSHVRRHLHQPGAAVEGPGGGRAARVRGHPGAMGGPQAARRAHVPGRVRANGAQRCDPDRRLTAEGGMRDRDLTRWERAWLSGEALVLAGVLLLAVLVSVAVLADLARA